MAGKGSGNSVLSTRLNGNDDDDDDDAVKWRKIIKICVAIYLLSPKFGNIFPKISIGLFYLFSKTSMTIHSFIKICYLDASYDIFGLVWFGLVWFGL